MCILLSSSNSNTPSTSTIAGRRSVKCVAGNSTAPVSFAFSGRWQERQILLSFFIGKNPIVVCGIKGGAFSNDLSIFSDSPGLLSTYRAIDLRLVSSDFTSASIIPNCLSSMISFAFLWLHPIRITANGIMKRYLFFMVSFFTDHGISERNFQSIIITNLNAPWAVGAFWWWNNTRSYIYYIQYMTLGTYLEAFTTICTFFWVVTDLDQGKFSY